MHTRRFWTTQILAGLMASAVVCLVSSPASAQPAACTNFTDQPLAAGTFVKAVQLTELRGCVNALRGTMGLPVFGWTNPDPVAGLSVIRAADITDLRSALAAVYTAGGQTPPSYSSAIGVGALIRQIDIAQLRSFATSAPQSLQCTYVVSPTSISVASPATTAVVNVTTQSGCLWEASTSALWFTLPGGAGGTGNTTITLNISENPSTTGRSATLVVAGQPVSVAQAGAPAPASPVISGISPASGDAGTEVTITGSSFGSLQGGASVWIGTRPGVVVTWSDTQIVAAVAFGASSGVVQVRRDPLFSNTVAFTVFTPAISSVTPTSGPVGTAVTVNGSGFGAEQGSGQIWLGTQPGIVTSWTDSQVVASVAPGSSTASALILQGGILTNAVSFTVTGETSQAADGVVYYHTDAIGSVRMVTDASGQVLNRYDDQPFGGPWSASPSGPEVRRFAGKERDIESGFEYFGARYYASSNGRFTSVDPVLDMDQALVDPQRWNRYIYVRNNPFRYVDPDGRAIETLWDAFNIGLGLSSLVDNIRQGSYGSAALDAGGVVVDVAAAAVPFVPGGAGSALRAARLAERAGDVAGLLPAVSATRIERVLESAAETGGKQGTSAYRALASHIDRGQKVYQGVEKSEGGARRLIGSILKEQKRVFTGKKTTDVYDSAGRGVRFRTDTGEFIGFLDESIASR
jgi:RHS repeat-associated protein